MSDPPVPNGGPNQAKQPGSLPDLARLVEVAGASKKVFVVTNPVFETIGRSLLSLALI